MAVVTAVGVIGGLTLLLATLLFLASRWLYVAEDPRLETVEEMLPHNNCGACGYPSCHLFAEALVRAEALPVSCTVSSDTERGALADFLNVEVGTAVRQVARLACAGGSNVASRRARYLGVATCATAAQVAGGGKGCAWGCLGFGDCVTACTFDAITLDAHGLPVVDEAACTACGDCIEACPKDLFSLQRVDQHLWVPCANLEAGDEVLAVCQVACTACGRCALDAPGELVRMHNNLPLIDYTRGQDLMDGRSSRVAIERCPTGAIVWFDADKGPVTGRAARRVVRRSARHIAPT